MNIKSKLAMNDDRLIIRTSISSSLKRSVLLRGSIVAVVGGIVILAGGFISKGILTIWGLPLYLVGFGLITIGLLPQRKLQLLENSPNEIHIDHDLILTFRSKGKPIFTTPLASFEKIEYVDSKLDYGIAFWFVQPPIHTIILFKPRFQLDKLQAESRKKFGCDLFLPYFSKRSHKELLDFIGAETIKSE